MATKTFHIEVVVSNVDTPERMLAVRDVIKNAGRGIHAKLLLICGEKPPPEIELYGENIDDGHQPINLNDEDKSDA